MSRHPRALPLTVRSLLAGALATIAAGLAASEGSALRAQEPPRPVRNDVPRPAAPEFLVLRHQKLQPRTHELFYQLSRDGVWPYFEKIGARIVGQWQVIRPEGGGREDFDEGYRLARYRSFEHWAATRRAVELGGNGPDYDAMRAALEARSELRLGSDGPIYLEGEMAPGGPYFLPGLPESYAPVAAGRPADEEPPRPVRHGRARRGEEIVTLRRFAIRKGKFEEFYRLSRDGVWPYFEKMGARVIGQWKRVYPAASDLEPGSGSATAGESPDFDEAFMMVRYASYEHWLATRPEVMAELGGDGPDYYACRNALALRGVLTLETSVRFLRGHVFHSPPLYLPALDERYRLSP